jgi:hypothetical protein
MMAYDDDLDHTLSREEEILPSSGFAASVMEAVRREAAAPPPIPFPWKRALPGLAVAGFTLAAVVLVLVAGITQLARQSASTQLSVTWMSAFTPIVKSTMTSTVAWILFALGLTLTSVMFSQRLAGSKG